MTEDVEKIKLVELTPIQLPSGRVMEDVLVKRLMDALKPVAFEPDVPTRVSFDMSPGGHKTQWPGEVSFTLDKDIEVGRFHHALTPAALEKVMDAVETKREEMRGIEATQKEEVDRDYNRRRFGNQPITPRSEGGFIAGRGRAPRRDKSK